MATYFVEGNISVKIDMDIEAESLEQAEQKVMEYFLKDPHALLLYGEVVDDGSDLMAGQYDDEEYTD
jgi:hypothetical protein